MALTELPSNLDNVLGNSSDKENGPSSRESSKGSQKIPEQGIKDKDSRPSSKESSKGSQKIADLGSKDSYHQKVQRSLSDSTGSKSSNNSLNKIKVLPESIDHVVIVSWKIRQFNLLEKALRPRCIAIQYRTDATLESILTKIEEVLDGRKVTSLAFICHGSPGKLVICHEQVLSVKLSAADQNEIMEFFKDLVSMFLDRGNLNARIDILSCPLVVVSEGIQLIQNLQEFIGVPVNVSKELLGGDSTGKPDSASAIGETYFKPELLRSWSGSGNQSISNFEKIRTVGKGAYGTAVLYRKRDDDSLVILKEITITDLSANERLMAKNEVKVLSMLSHPNIISYFDSFEEDGTLWIEMEYADGGTLAQYLSKLEKEQEEKEILLMFLQMVSAIKYIHDHNILHRDLKTANVFLTQEGTVKLGDFGIAKIMSTRQDANTVVGTPYYISPEMCEGKPYNEKSDIWALGCILYEMANLQKTFEGTNLPALVNKIMKGTFAPVKETYSVAFRVLVRDMLSKEPSMRPSSQELLIYRLPELLQKFDSKHDNDELELFGGARRSLLYYADMSTMTLYPVAGLPPKIQLTEVAVGLGHVVAVSMERGIFSWGDNTYGQLGLGDMTERELPTEINSLRGKATIRATCGDNFTVFLSDNGLILTCGQGDYGCLGHGNYESLLKPKLIDGLLTLDVVSVSSGRQHVAIATADGLAYTWGCGDDGRLGHGNEDTLCDPTEVVFNEPVFVRDVGCSDDGTVFIMDSGALFACGRNDHNKLRLNPRQGFLQQIRFARSNKNTTEFSKTPLQLKDLCKYQFTDVSFGSNHTALLTEGSQLILIGNNADGQLGSGNTKSRDIVTTLKGLEEEPIVTMACGPKFSVVGTGDSVIYFWGTRPPKRTRLRSSDSSSPNQSMNASSRSFHKRSVSSMDDLGLTVADADHYSSKSDSESRGGSARRQDGLRKARTDSAKSLTDRHSYTGSLNDDMLEAENEKMDERRKYYLRSISRKQHGLYQQPGTLRMADKENQAIVSPVKVFEFATICGIEGYEESEEYPVILQDLKCYSDHVFIQLETKAPPPKRRKRLSRKESRQRIMGRKAANSESSFSSVNSHAQDEQNSSETSEMDTTGEVPSWIKDELKSGIPLSKEGNASSDADSESDVEDGDATPKLLARRQSNLDSKRTFSEPQLINRRYSIQSLTKDGHRGSIHRLQKRDRRLSNLSLAGRSETRIIDGVAITTNENFTHNAPSIDSSSTSSPVTESETSPPPRQGYLDDQKLEVVSELVEKSDEESLTLSKVFPRPAKASDHKDKEKAVRKKSLLSTSDSGVELTPVEKFSSSDPSDLSLKRIPKNNIKALKVDFSWI